MALIAELIEAGIDLRNPVKSVYDNAIRDAL
jgi:hypothetical protein